MARTGRSFLVVACAAVVCLAWGCRVYHNTEEIRSEEQMLEVSFENERAEELFVQAVKTTYGDVINAKRIGVPGLWLYSHDQTVAWNANCNDHIRKMDTNGDRVITEQEAQSYYDAITSR